MQYEEHPAGSSGRVDTVRFNPAHASPAISPGETVKSISLMMDQGPDHNSGHAVLDNLNINDRFIGHE
jgi:hypothetical protein